MLFHDVDRQLLASARPSGYLRDLMEKGAFQIRPFDIFPRMAGTEQDPKHHPEGDVFTHTLMVVDQAARRRHDSGRPRALLWAALLHDIGKPDTTVKRGGKITAYNHDTAGAALSRGFLSEVTEDTEFIRQVSALVRWHMQVLFVNKNLPFAKLSQMVKEVDYREVALIAYCDRMGRTDADVEKERRSINHFVEKAELFAGADRRSV